MVVVLVLPTVAKITMVMAFQTMYKSWWKRGLFDVPEEYATIQDAINVASAW